MERCHSSLPRPPTVMRACNFRKGHFPTAHGSLGKPSYTSGFRSSRVANAACRPSWGGMQHPAGPGHEGWEGIASPGCSPEGSVGWRRRRMLSRVPPA